MSLRHKQGVHAYPEESLLAVTSVVTAGTAAAAAHAVSG